ncbi:hypothetical protein QJS66_18805 [Kocuria rhizophila]|nr:hypothetical protein QJS66_18805 [Kocuria rhizophila]
MKWLTGFYFGRTRPSPGSSPSWRTSGDRRPRGELHPDHGRDHPARGQVRPLPGGRRHRGPGDRDTTDPVRANVPGPRRTSSRLRRRRSSWRWQGGWP